MKWHCKDGSIIDHTEMSDAHLVNSIKYTEKKMDWQGHKLLCNEHKRRWSEEKIGCMWCDGQMTRHEDGDVDTWMPVYRWFCGKCGARSGPVEGWRKPQ